MCRKSQCDLVEMHNQPTQFLWTSCSWHDSRSGSGMSMLNPVLELSALTSLLWRQDCQEKHTVDKTLKPLLFIDTLKFLLLHFTAFQKLPQNNRVSQSLNGDLYFSNVIPEDTRDDYICYARFNHTQTIQQKQPISLKVEPGRYGLCKLFYI